MKSDIDVGICTKCSNFSFLVFKGSMKIRKYCREGLLNDCDPPVQECKDFFDKSWVALNHLSTIGWNIDSHRKDKIGFAPPDKISSDNLRLIDPLRGGY